MWMVFLESLEERKLKAGVEATPPSTLRLLCCVDIPLGGVKREENHAGRNR